jgi:hypothetical protein
VIDPNQAVDAIKAHLADKGLELDRAEWSEGSPPTMVTKKSERGPSLWVFLGDGVKTCCGCQREPDDWEHETRHLRENVEYNKTLFEKNPKGRFTLDQIVEVVCLRGSVGNHTRQLESLAEELGVRLIVIDEHLRVASAGV